MQKMLAIFPYIAPEHRLPRLIVYLVLFICFAPVILQVFGVDFGNTQHALPAGNHIDQIFHQLNGAFTHALLEWTAFCAALFVVILSFSHYVINRDVTTPVICIALFCAGIMDAFHTLAATRLISAVAENNDLIPFTWALSRVFNAAIMLIGVGIFLFDFKIKRQQGINFVIAISVFFALIGYGLIYMAATSESLPQTQFPDAFIRRPYDVIPLVLFLIAGGLFYPLFIKKHPSIFASALLLSIVPEIVIELHMAFGSQRLFDSDFNVAHFLKILAYAIPLVGLILDYVHTYVKQLKNHQILEETHQQLNRQASQLKFTNQHLNRSNQELEKFAYIASHDLQEPLRKIQAFGDRLHKTLDGTADAKAFDYIARMQSASARMRSLIDDLLKFSRLSNQDISLKPVELDGVITEVRQDLQLRIDETKAQLDVGSLPTIAGESVMLYQLFLNVIGNALKFSHADRTPHIRIDAINTTFNGQAAWQITVADNGIGFDQKYADKIFEIFQRLHGIGQYQGTGIGLAICQKIIDKHQGHISVSSVRGEGSKFTLIFLATGVEDVK